MTLRAKVKTLELYIPSLQHTIIMHIIVICLIWPQGPQRGSQPLGGLDVLLHNSWNSVQKNPLDIVERTANQSTETHTHF